MTSFFARISSLGAVALTALLPFVARAQRGGTFVEGVLKGADSAAAPAGLTQTPVLEIVIGNVIATLISFVGVLLICIMLYAGFLWMTAGGEEDKVKKARALIMNSVIGLVIVFSAYAIVRFVIERLTGVAAVSG